MPFGFSTLSEISLIAIIDGPGCEEESTMGYAGLVIWIPITLYLMRKEYKNNTLINKKLDQVFNYLVSLQTENAKEILDDL